MSKISIKAVRCPHCTSELPEVEAEEDDAVAEAAATDE